MPYSRRPIVAPRLTGFSLWLATALAGGPLGPLLRRKFLADVGIAEFRAAQVEHAPMAKPNPPAPAAGGPAIELAALSHEPSPSGFGFETAAAFAAAYREGRSNPAEVAEKLVAAIEASEQSQPPLRALIAHDPADLRRQARESQQRFARGEPLGPLDGVPVAVKDEVDMVPYRTTVGTRFLGAEPAERDATTVARLRAAGALLFGKTNMHEIGLTPTGLNPHHGACRNPYDLERDTGGSSSGVACAVAAGFCPIGLGADGGGSIRIPASLCGLVGLKPTFGRVSEHGAAPVCWSVAHLGPIGATALDCALGYAILAGRDDRDPETLGQPAPTLDGLFEDLRGLKLGMPVQWFDDADPEVVQTCRRLVDGLVSQGATLIEIDIPDLESLQLGHLVTITSEMLASQRRHLGTHAKHYGRNVQLILSLASGLDSSDYVQAQRARALAHERFREVLTRVDAIMTPASAVTAPRLRPDALPYGESDITLVDALMRFVRPGNFLGLPSISFPAGYDAQGLPIGLMATGRFWQESTLLRLARAAEALVERRPPQFHRRLLA
jgi:Asp-tRNA(Asn)/Glu-tRNA(Gln) amidotransferase A subunit family amidase